MFNNNQLQVTQLESKIMSLGRGIHKGKTQTHTPTPPTKKESLTTQHPAVAIICLGEKDDYD